jgi:hypothetical protein
MNDWQMDLVTVGDRAERLLPALVQAAGLAPAPDLSRI